MAATPAGPSTERERKYLVHGEPWRQDPWRAVATSTRIVQGYLSLDPERTVRVRVRDDEARLTVKGRARGDTRVEYEYPIPAQDAEHLFALCQGHLVEKVRHVLPDPPYEWEVDEFLGDNAGLVVAECEHPGGDAAWPPPLPSFVAMEATSLDDALQRRLVNASLAEHPYPQWRRELEAALREHRGEVR